MRPVMVWPWKETPEALRVHSKSGGDEDGAALIPCQLIAQYGGVPHFIEALWSQDPDPQMVDLSGGDLLVIWCHA